jgi:hypothetical protein
MKYILVILLGFVLSNSVPCQVEKNGLLIEVVPEKEVFLLDEGVWHEVKIKNTSATLQTLPHPGGAMYWSKRLINLKTNTEVGCVESWGFSTKLVQLDLLPGQEVILPDVILLCGENNPSTVYWLYGYLPPGRYEYRIRFFRKRQLNEAVNTENTYEVSFKFSIAEPTGNEKTIHDQLLDIRKPEINNSTDGLRKAINLWNSSAKSAYRMAIYREISSWYVQFANKWPSDVRPITAFVSEAAQEFRNHPLAWRVAQDIISIDLPQNILKQAEKYQIQDKQVQTRDELIRRVGYELIEREYANSKFAEYAKSELILLSSH